MKGTWTKIHMVKMAEVYLFQKKTFRCLNIVFRDIHKLSSHFSYIF